MVERRKKAAAALKLARQNHRASEVEAEQAVELLKQYSPEEAANEDLEAGASANNFTPARSKRK